MAESIIAVVEMLTSLVLTEVRHLKDMKEKVMRLKEQLMLIQSVVKNADATRGGNEVYNCWLSQVRDLGYQAVDVLETYRNESESSGFFYLRVIRFRDLNGEIDKIQSRLEDLYKLRDSFSISQKNNPEVEAANQRQASQLRMWREAPAIMNEDDYINLVENTEELIAQLSDKDLRVVSIVGMGGLGKTTLANKLYNHANLRFDCKAFVSVSREYTRKDILLRILQGVCPDHHVLDPATKEPDEKILMMKLNSFLEKKRYLVVLDDIWEKTDWENLAAAFPSGREGKVLLTTRNRELAGSTTFQEPRMLTEDESLELLGKRAFLNNEDFTPALKKLGGEMVKKCGGLPLAVVVLAGLLSGRSEEEWENMSRNSKWRIMNDVEDRVPMILALSYNFLPFHLKLCFQHLAIYPEDFCIPKNELIRLWVAERFLPRQGHDTEESIAESCIHDLINKSMVLVEKRTTRGRVKAIRIHDVLRDFSIKKAQESKFLEVYSGLQVGPEALRSLQSRRLAFHGTYNDYAFVKPYTPHLRSLHFFSSIDRKVESLCKQFKLLNVLEVNCSAVYSDGNLNCSALSRLPQLRYLGFRGWSTHLFNVESSNGKWSKLQTLDLRRCKCEGPLPDMFSRMKRLRHLLFNSSIGVEHLRLDTLVHLQTLKGICSGSWVKYDLAMMKSMRRLEIHLTTREHATLVFNSVAALPLLQSLSLKRKTDGTGIFPIKSIPPFEQISSCASLKKLYLDGKIENLPAAHEFPPELVKLVLNGSRLQQGSIATLERLPKLQMLVLNQGAYTASEMVCSSEGFPVLEILHLRSLRALTKWTVKEYAMMKLKYLSIRECRLQQVPEGFESLTALMEIDMHGSFSSNARLQAHQKLVEFTKKHSIKFAHYY